MIDFNLMGENLVVRKFRATANVLHQKNGGNQ